MHALQRQEIPSTCLPMDTCAAMWRDCKAPQNASACTRHCLDQKQMNEGSKEQLLQCNCPNAIVCPLRNSTVRQTPPTDCLATASGASDDTHTSRRSAGPMPAGLAISNVNRWLFHKVCNVAGRGGTTTTALQCGLLPLTLQCADSLDVSLLSLQHVSQFG